MRRLKLFNNHLEYTDYMDSNEVPTPNVSYCIEEDEVHYDNGIRILPENEEIWEEYCAFICDDAELEQDLRNIFSKYVVTVANYSHKYGYQEPDTDYGRKFSYYDERGFLYERIVVTCYSVYMVGCDHSREHTNDCGETYVSLGSWALHIDSPIIGPN